MCPPAVSYYTAAACTTAIPTTSCALSTFYPAACTAAIPTTSCTLSTFYNFPCLQLLWSEWVCFVFRNCQYQHLPGCHNKFTQVDDIAVKHVKYHEFTNPRKGLLMSKYGNAYYHAKQCCLRLRWGDAFQTDSLVIDKSMHPQLSLAHKDLILREFCVVV